MRIFLALFVALTLAPPVLAEERLELLAGVRKMLDDAWEPVESPGTVGLSVSYARDAWPIFIEGAILYATDRKWVCPDLPTTRPEQIGCVTYYVESFEVSFGMAKIWRRRRTEPYLGAGLAYVDHLRIMFDNDFPGGDEQERDASGAIYAHGGVRWTLGSRITLGLDARANVLSDITVVNIDIVPGTSFSVVREDKDADYIQVSLTIGWRSKER